MNGCRCDTGIESADGQIADDSQPAAPLTIKFQLSASEFRTWLVKSTVRLRLKSSRHRLSALKRIIGVIEDGRIIIAASRG